MGLELNAETPEEIAVSMLAEIIQIRRGGTGERMAHEPSLQEPGLPDLPMVQRPDPSQKQPRL
jgi:hypothetical protein